MKNFNIWLEETHPDFEIDEGLGGWMAKKAAPYVTAGAIGAASMFGGQQAQAERPTGAVSGKRYDQAKVIKIEEIKNNLEVTIKMPYSLTYERIRRGFHLKIVKAKALEAAAKNLGVTERDLVVAGVDKPMQKGKIYIQKIYITGAGR